jgi:hypothetical protein
MKKIADIEKMFLVEINGWKQLVLETTDGKQFVHEGVYMGETAFFHWAPIEDGVVKGFYYGKKD